MMRTELKPSLLFHQGKSCSPNSLEAFSLRLPTSPVFLIRSQSRAAEKLRQRQQQKLLLRRKRDAEAGFLREHEKVS